MSLAVAPYSIYSLNTSNVKGLSPLIVITGGVVSTILTCLVTLVILSPASIAVYIILYSPIWFIQTSLVDSTLTTPLYKSNALAPGSINSLNTSNVKGLSPLIVITGGVVSTTIIIREASLEIPLESVAV